MTLADFIERFDITATFNRTSAPMGVSGDVDWPVGSRHFMVTLKCGYRQTQMSTPYNVGPAITDDRLTAEDVLECLLSDAATLVNSGHDISEWRGELGLEANTRTRAMFNGVTKQYAQLQKFLGDDLDTALWHLDR